MTKLQNKMILSYSFIAILIVLALSVLFNLSLDKLFEQYANRQRDLQIERITEQVNQQYSPNDRTYNIAGLELIGNAALQNGIMVHVQTVSMEIDWDIQQHRAQECQLQLQHAEMNMHSRYPNFKGGYTENNYDLVYDGEVAGYLTIGYYGPYSLDDNELALINSLNRTLIIAGIIFLSMAIILGIIMARRLSSPITKAISIAQRIAGGDYDDQELEATSTLETTNLLSSLKEMSLALEKKDQQKRQITEDVAHELRTPLSNIQSHMEALIDGVWEPTTDRLQSCHAEVVRISKLVDQLAELSMLENESPAYDRALFDFNDLCTSIIADFESAKESCDAKLILDIPKPAPLYGDISRVKQCIVNLLSNAIKYTREDSEVRIAYEKQQGEVVLRVSDNGVGIPSDSLPHIFERFYRVDKSRSKNTGGMGVGLSITKAIVEGHGGKITVNSVYGEGTTFSITLPDHPHKIPTSSV